VSYTHSQTKHLWKDKEDIPVFKTIQMFSTAKYYVTLRIQYYEYSSKIINLKDNVTQTGLPSTPAIFIFDHESLIQV